MQVALLVGSAVPDEDEVQFVHDRKINPVVTVAAILIEVV